MTPVRRISQNSWSIRSVDNGGRGLGLTLGSQPEQQAQTMAPEQSPWASGALVGDRDPGWKLLRQGALGCTGLAEPAQGGDEPRRSRVPSGVSAVSEDSVGATKAHRPPLAPRPLSKRSAAFTVRSAFARGSRVANA